MSRTVDWEIPGEIQPKPADCAFDLDRALSAVLGLRATVPEDAFTAGTLGTERAGSGVLIGKDGLVLTIGYLVTEAETIWLHLNDGRVVPGHVLGYDQTTGFGLVQALSKLDLPALPLGDSTMIPLEEKVVVGGAGGRQRSVAARIAGKQEFAGYWEYVLDEAIFTAPAHPNWGGTALIGPSGDLLGIGSLQLERARDKGPNEHLNMIVPIDDLKPVYDDLMKLGRPNRPPRPWLGLYATEVEGKIVVVGLATRGPAQAANIRTGDIILAVDSREVSELSTMFRKVWSLGNSGVDVPLLVYRDGRTFELKVPSADRRKFLKAPRLH